MIVASTRQEFARYFLQGLASVLLQATLTSLFCEILDLPTNAAFALNLAIVFVFNFVTLRTYVFRAVGGRVWRQFLAVILISASFRLVDYYAFTLVAPLFRGHYVLAIPVALSFSFILKFVLYRRVIS